MFIRNSVPTAQFIADLLSGKAAATGSESPFRLNEGVKSELQAAGAAGLEAELVEISPSVSGGNWFGEGERKGQQAYIGSFSARIKIGTHTTFANIDVATALGFTMHGSKQVVKIVQPVNRETKQPVTTQRGEAVYNIVAVTPLTVDFEKADQKAALTALGEMAVKAAATTPGP